MTERYSFMYITPMHGRITSYNVCYTKLLRNTRQNILTIPIQSVTTRKDTADIDEKSLDKKEKEKIEVAFVVKDGAIEQRKVTTGIQDEMHIEISEGIEEGEEVVSAPYSAISKKLKDKDLVEIVDKLFEEKK